MRRLACFLAVCAISACTSSESDIGDEIRENPPVVAGPGKVTIWMSSAAPVLPKWPRVKTWNASIARCSQSAIGPEVSATTDDGLPVAIRVLQPSGQQARLVAFIQYASDGTPPRSDELDEQLLIVSDQPFSSAEAGATKGDFSGGFSHARPTSHRQRIRAARWRMSHGDALLAELPGLTVLGPRWGRAWAVNSRKTSDNQG